MQEHERCRHPDCVYRNRRDPVNMGRCNYLELTGRSRTAGLPEELRLPCNCPCYEGNGEPAAQPEEDWREKALRLYEAGATDSEIAEALGFARERVGKWRRRTLKKPPNKDRRGTEPRFDWKRARELYRQGLNDLQIARELKCHASTVWQWRNKNGLPVNRRPGREGGKDGAV